MATLKPTSKPKLRSKAVAALAADPPPVIGRTSSGGFKTQEGTLYVSKPFRSQRSKKLRAMVAFMPRKSAFDTTNEMSGANEFRVSNTFISSN
jgi:sterol O-acyltransferase